MHLAADEFGPLFALVERWTYLRGMGVGGLGIGKDGGELIF